MARRGIPGIKVELPESIETPTGHVAEIKGSRPGAAHAVGAQRELVIEMDVRVLVALVTGEARGDQTFGQPRGFRDVNGAAVEHGSAALRGGKHLVAARIVDHAGDAVVLVF